jgi:hypothetical protein
MRDPVLIGSSPDTIVRLTKGDNDEPRILPFPSGEVKCRERLGGQLRHYYRTAA